MKFHRLTSSPHLDAPLLSLIDSTKLHAGKNGYESTHRKVKKIPLTFFHDLLIIEANDRS